jgi:hypothetical protein
MEEQNKQPVQEATEIKHPVKTNPSTLQDASGQASSGRSWKYLVIVLVLALIAVGAILLLQNIQPEPVAQTPAAPTPKSQTINIFTTDCREFVSGHNSLRENRIDLVLIGFDYTSLGKFLEVAETAIDFNGEGQGLFALEPFRSNKERFNIWYVSRIGDTNNQTKDNWELSSICRERIGLNDHVFTHKDHLFSDKMFTLFLVNNVSKGHTRGQIYSFNPVNYSCTPQDDNGLCGLKGNRIDMAEDGTNQNISLHDFVHEFAHVFPMQNFYFEYRPPEYYNILDEYVRFDEPYPAREYKNVVKEHSNCFVGTYEQCMSKQNTLFGDMIGGGCGRDGVIDCCTNDESAIQEGALSCEVCPDCKEDSRYDLEIACYENCWASSGIYRSTLRSIMSSRVGTQEYGKLDEKLLCFQVKLLTGSAGGICNQLLK